MKKNIKIKLKKQIDNSYNILISSNINIAKEIKNLKLNNNFAIITDNIVYKLYHKKIINEFKKEKLNYKFFIFKNGEKQKNIKTFHNISEKMLNDGFDRKSCIIALGGGVVGDIAGYIAGTFMRGIPFIQVPTTLLSQVDSSIGGKVAINLQNGKNTSGLFYQPIKVIIDIDFLNTLPEIEINNGMYEIIKHSIIRSKKYFKFINDNIKKIKKRDPGIMINMIYQSCLIKSEIVQKDEKENNLRRILNFGHTIGHAIESLSKYKLKHGFAIGLGMIMEAEISHKLKYLSKKELEMQKYLINEFNIQPFKFNLNKLLIIIQNDKKNIKSGNNLHQSIPLVLPVSTGKTIIKDFNIKELKSFLS